MIKANELRIGNWVNAYGKPIEIENFNKNGINMSYGEFFAYLDDVTPIPLTPEILEKARFIKESGVYIIQLSEDGNHLSLKKKNNGFVCLSHKLNYVLKHVHQLQYLYFALTGEELEINV